VSDDRGNETSRTGAPTRESGDVSEGGHAREAAVARDDRAFALDHRLAVMEARERDLSELIVGHREQIARLGAEREGLQARLAEQKERVEELKWRARDAEAAVADRDLRSQQLEEKVNRLDSLETELAEQGARVATLKQQLTSRDKQARKQKDEHDRLLQRVEALQSSRSYKLMRVLWRVSAAVRHPIRRSRRQQLVPVTGRGPSAPAETSAPAKGLAPTMAPELGDSEGRSAVEGDGEVRVKPERSRSQPTDPRDLRVAAVLDEMSANCFRPECDLLTFDSEDWQERLEEHQPHLLLVESAWRGNGESWRYQVGSYPRADLRGLPKLRALVDWCRQRDIPTAFWGKEDPIHFDRFKEAAALFDYVFTTDGNCVPRYEQLQREGTGPVRALQFAAQPRMHNPISIDQKRSDSPCFAGTYYRNRHLDRRQSLEMLLDAARPFGLVIYDRTFDWDNDTFGFPERFLPHVRGSLPYSEVVRAYKSHKVFLNVNSVVDSPTMFSRRVFELLACDAAVLTTESEGVERTFGELVPVATTPDQATEALTHLIHDDDYRREIVVPARRLVMTEHTYRQRLALIGQTMGYSVSAALGDGIAALALIDDADQARKVSDLVAAISSQRSVPGEFLIGLGLETSVAGDLHELSDARSDVRVQVVQQDQGGERTKRFRELASLASSPWVGIVDPAHHYGEYHFMDLLVCTRFAQADVIGSAAFDVISDAASTQDDLELSYVDSVHPHSAIASRKLVVNRGWPDRMPGAGETLRDWSRHGIRFFSGSATNFRADPALGLPPRAAAQVVESAYAG
jgi:uncharacterized coiled-coil protein SlyX